MRIIAGKFRGRRLKSPPSQQTRPTSDRLRETLFSIIAPKIEGARLLDLCAGTGAVGIEALSRGAEHVSFVDQSREMCQLIDANLNSLAVNDDEYEVMPADALHFLQSQLNKGNPAFDIVFFDPPYAADYEVVLNFVGQHAAKLLTPTGIMIVEHYQKKALAESFDSLTSYRKLRQGDSVLSFYHVSQ